MSGPSTAPLRETIKSKFVEKLHELLEATPNIPSLTVSELHDNQKRAVQVYLPGCTRSISGSNPHELYCVSFSDAGGIEAITPISPNVPRTDSKRLIL